MLKEPGCACLAFQLEVSDMKLCVNGLVMDWTGAGGQIGHRYFAGFIANFRIIYTFGRYKPYLISFPFFLFHNIL